MRDSTVVVDSVGCNPDLDADSTAPDLHRDFARGHVFRLECQSAANTMHEVRASGSRVTPGNTTQEAVKRRSRDGQEAVKRRSKTSKNRQDRLT